jgi:hypothetical protein
MRREELRRLQINRDEWEQLIERMEERRKGPFAKPFGRGSSVREEPLLFYLECPNKHRIRVTVFMAI